MGKNGVPLRYVIRKNPYPKYNKEYEKSYGFDKLCINCIPLSVLV